MDFFAGSGTTGEAAARNVSNGREYILVDNNPEAIGVMSRRLAFDSPELVGCDDLERGKGPTQQSLFWEIG